MTPPHHLLGVLFGVLSALIWGSADFTGGYASRSHPPFQVVLVTALTGTLLLAVLAALTGEAWPTLIELAWALVAGVCGGLGLVALYRGLSTGNAGLVAPTAAVVGAAFPLIVGMLLDGFPGWYKAAGLVFGVLGIWQVSSVSESSAPADGRVRAPRAGFTLALLAGVFFGGFFLFIAQADRSALFMPLAISKVASFAIVAAILLAQRQPFATPRQIPLAILGGVLDVGGNLFYLLAQQYTRLDVAVMVSSMYPVSTVILAAVLLKERAGVRQWVGLGLCVLALALIVV